MCAHEEELNWKCFCILKHFLCCYKTKLRRFINIFGHFPSALVGYEMIIANSAIYHLISDNVHLRNNCLCFKIQRNLQGINLNEIINFCVIIFTEILKV